MGDKTYSLYLPSSYLKLPYDKEAAFLELSSLLPRSAEGILPWQFWLDRFARLTKSRKNGNFMVPTYVF